MDRSQSQLKKTKCNKGIVWHGISTTDTNDNDIYFSELKEQYYPVLGYTLLKYNMQF